MTKISFELAGLTLLEPMAFILNWVLMIQAWFYFSRLKNRNSSTFSSSWRWFFLIFGISGCFGGVSHLLYNYTGVPGKFPGWLAAIVAVSLMEFAMVSLAEGKLRKGLQYLVGTKLVVSATLLILYLNFTVVMIHSSVMGLFLLVPSLLYLVKGRSELSYFLIGALTLVASLPFKLLAIDFHLWFNRDDIGHIFMMMALYCFYKGVLVHESNPDPAIKPA